MALLEGTIVVFKWITTVVKHNVLNMQDLLIVFNGKIGIEHEGEGSVLGKTVVVGSPFLRRLALFVAPRYIVE